VIVVCASRPARQRPGGVMRGCRRPRRRRRRPCAARRHRREPVGLLDAPAADVGEPRCASAKAQSAASVIAASGMWLQSSATMRAESDRGGRRSAWGSASIVAPIAAERGGPDRRRRRPGSSRCRTPSIAADVRGRSAANRRGGDEVTTPTTRVPRLERSEAARPKRSPGVRRGDVEARASRPRVTAAPNRSRRLQA
jgi:hypothetical protein